MSCEPSSTKFLCFYFCPNDGETQDSMNCFMVEDRVDITIGDAIREFPLTGDYHFRIGFKDKLDSWIWVDPPNPQFSLVQSREERRAFLKVTRKTWEPSTPTPPKIAIIPKAPIEVALDPAGLKVKKTRPKEEDVTTPSKSLLDF